jgi:hypothetical protein
MYCYQRGGHYNQNELHEINTAMHCLAIDTSYALIDFNGTLATFMKNHVSGQIMTVIINSFANSAYLRMAYRRCIPEDSDLVHFSERVRLVTYGDDFIVSVKPDYTDRLNFRTIKDAMATFGIEITPASKEMGVYNTTQIEKLDFLKRNFLFSDDLNRWVGPLKEKSICKSLLIGLKSDSITHEEQAVFTMMSAVQEYFFHGRDKFNEFRDQVLECIEYYNLGYLVRECTFPHRWLHGKPGLKADRQVF